LRVNVDLNSVEEASKELYIRALKLLPDDIKRGFATLQAGETHATAKSVLGTMVRNIAVALPNLGRFRVRLGVEWGEIQQYGQDFVGHDRRLAQN
jgi:hypothetical protein